MLLLNSVGFFSLHYFSEILTTIALVLVENDQSMPHISNLH